MTKPNSFQPEWREDIPAEGTYRSILKCVPDQFKHPSAAWYNMFKQEFGLTDDDFKQRQPGGDDRVAIDHKSRLAEEQVQALRAIVGPDNIADDDYSRVKYGHGKSLDENLALRRGAAGHVPDLVAHPRNKEDVQRLVAYCNGQRIPVITCGGASSVVLGVEAERGGVALAMGTHMNQVLAVNEQNQTAVVQPGILGPDYEDALNHAPERFGVTRRYTGGHFPQSFEISTVGGWIMALGSGQASTYYGDACDLVLSQEFVTPVGTLTTHSVPGTATGPKVNDILKGSEGAFGVLVEATMRVYRYAPENRQRFAFMFPSWEAAVDASREIAQGEFGLPAVYRISDAEETEVGLKLKEFSDGWVAKYLKLRGLDPMKRCLCIGTVEGEQGFTRHARRCIAQTARRFGGVSLSGYATKQWEKGRYSDIHMRDDLLDYGIIIDTLETGVAWDKLHGLHEGVRAFVKSRPRTICLSHASHFYPQGANLYFIFMMKPESDREFFAFRDGVVDKILEHGGTISHHHGIGRLFAPWLESHLGSEQVEVLRALKRHFDPNGILNPGALFGAACARTSPAQDAGSSDEHTR